MLSGADEQFRRQPVLFFCTVNQGIFGALAMINSFPSERLLVLRERAAGTYQASAYYLSKILAETIPQVIPPIIFSCIVYPLIGLRPGFVHFLIFTCFMILTALAAISLALMISAVARTTSLSVTILPMALEMARLFGAFFLAPINLPVYFIWLDWTSYVKWAYIGISLNELQGLQLTCPSPPCAITSGAQTIAQLGFGVYTMGSCALALIIFCVITRFIAYLGIRYLKT